jgi:hypothetical protein
MRLRIKHVSLLICGGLSLYLFMSCGGTIPLPQAENVFTVPGVDYGQYKNLAFYIDFSAVGFDKQDYLLVLITEDELRKLGYDLAAHSEFDSLKTRNMWREEDFHNPVEMDKVTEYFGSSALLMGKMKSFDISTSVDTPMFIDATSRGPGYVVPAGSVTSTEKSMVDMRLEFEMIDIKSGEKIWGCSLTCDSFKLTKKWHITYREILKSCLLNLSKK